MAKFVGLPVLDKKRAKESYRVNVDNINYYRRWTGDDGKQEQTVIYFNDSNKKYLVIDLSIAQVMPLLEK